jgi:hypothetical protein
MVFSMTVFKEQLLSLSDHSFQRTRGRLDGLTDEEYLWEPVPNCWTVRQMPDGNFAVDWAFSPAGSGSFTTIAWRLLYLINCYGSNRSATWLELEAVDGPGAKPDLLMPATVPSDTGFDKDMPSHLRTTPGTAAEALDMLDRAHEVWRRYLTTVTEESLGEPLGPNAGEYAGNPRAGFVFHMLDEFIHHGAELGVLRDLYRSQREPADPLVDALLGGDRDAVDAIRRDDPEAIDRLRASQPTIVRDAAETGRWHAIPLLLELGFAADVDDGAGAIHHAAAAGRLDIVQLLVDHGADVNRPDDTWNATPKGWAEFFRQGDVAAFLENKTTVGHD